jgi:hypothetical protein
MCAPFALGVRAALGPASVWDVLSAAGQSEKWVVSSD